MPSENLENKAKEQNLTDWGSESSNTTNTQRDFQMTTVNQNDTLFFEDGLAEMAFMMEIGEETGEGNDWPFPSSCKNLGR